MGGTAEQPLTGTCPNSEWLHSTNTQLQNTCKKQKATIIAKVVVGVGVPILFICFVIFWWCVRGRWWWHSTTHKRCFCSEAACCNGFLCCHPYDAQPPPHGKSKGPKSVATRVAPCFPHNPCAICDNLDAWKSKPSGEPIGDKYRPLHKCGLGLGCACYWIPGMCCLFVVAAMGSHGAPLTLKLTLRCFPRCVLSCAQQVEQGLLEYVSQVCAPVRLFLATDCLRVCLCPACLCPACPVFNTECCEDELDGPIGAAASPGSPDKNPAAAGAAPAEPQKKGWKSKLNKKKGNAA